MCIVRLLQRYFPPPVPSTRIASAKGVYTRHRDGLGCMYRCSIRQLVQDTDSSWHSQGDESLVMQCTDTVGPAAKRAAEGAEPAVKQATGSARTTARDVAGYVDPAAQKARATISPIAEVWASAFCCILLSWFPAAQPSLPKSCVSLCHRVSALYQ